MDENNAECTKEEYKPKINENKVKFVKDFNNEYKKEIDIFFEEEKTDVMSEVIEQLSKIFVDNIFNIEDLK